MDLCLVVEVNRTTLRRRAARVAKRPAIFRLASESVPKINDRVSRRGVDSTEDIYFSIG